jgi:hypothetical protein
MILVGVLTSALVLVCAATALAAGPPVNIGTPFESGAPAVAVDAAGNAYIAYANTKDLAPTTTNVVQYCVLAVNATGCSQSGTLTPADGASSIDGVQVLVDGKTVVILADVFGASSANGANPLDYEPEQEWQSTDGGATFTLLDGGKSVVEANLNADTAPLNAVIVPGTDVLGYGWNTAGGSPPTFAEFPLTSPGECSEATNHGCPFASLEPNTNPDQLGNGGGELASQPGASPGVMGIFNTDFTNGPLGCSGAQTVPFGTAFAYGTGVQSPTNDYNVSPGSANSAWKVPVTQADCNVESPAVDGGPSGFGVVEDNDLTSSTVYHRFDPATNSFDTPEVTVAKEGEQDPAVTQDQQGGVFLTYRAGPGGPIRAAYSYDGGTTWSGPATLNADTDQHADDVTSSVNPSSQGWAVWNDNGSVIAQSFGAADTVAPPAADTVTTKQVVGTTTGASVTIPAGTVGEKDGATITGTAASTAIGTVTYTLYSKASCVASSHVFSGGAVGVTAGVAPPSAPETASLAPGKYYWQAVYSGDGGNIFGLVGNLAGQSACGGEVLTVVPAATIAATGSSNGHALSIKVTCATTPCSGKGTITEVVPFAFKAGASRASAAKKTKKPKTKTVTIGSGKFTIKTKGAKTLKFGLTKAGKTFLAAHKGHVNAKFVLTETPKGGKTVLTTRTIRITIPKPKHKQK